MTDQAARTTVEADVLEREVIDENLLRRLLQRAGRGLAAPALEAMELMLDPETPSAARLTMLAALSYLCLLYTSPSPRDEKVSRMPSSA